MPSGEQKVTTDIRDSTTDVLEVVTTDIPDATIDVTE
jgi:hypothetical protein